MVGLRSVRGPWLLAMWSTACGVVDAPAVPADPTDTDAFDSADTDAAVPSDTDQDEDTDLSSDTDAPTDTDDPTDTDPPRQTLWPQFCPSSATAPGLYAGTLAHNLNDIASNSCTGASPGRDGSVRVSLAAGQTVSAAYRHEGSGILYILESCPVVSSCLDGATHSAGGQASVSYTNTTGQTKVVYVVLDSDTLAAPQGFELDLVVN